MPTCTAARLVWHPQVGFPILVSRIDDTNSRIDDIFDRMARLYRESGTERGENSGRQRES